MESILDRKGIILSGGLGSRLYPLTVSMSKQLMPIYDKPMIYYPLSTLMLANIREFLIIIKEEDYDNFFKLLGDGKKWGISIKYKFQKNPDGLAQAMILAEDFLSGHPSALILGDNLFHGSEVPVVLKEANSFLNGATIFSYPVRDPERYGVINFDKMGNPISIEEKPKKSKSNYAITGLYFYDSLAPTYAKSLKPSERGELEITSLNKIYLQNNSLRIKTFSRGTAWLDTGTIETLHEASSYIRTLENRQGLKAGCPEEISWRNGWINNEQLLELSYEHSKSGYGDYLKMLLT